MSVLQLLKALNGISRQVIHFAKTRKNAALYESGIVEKRRRLLLFILVGETIDHIEVNPVLLDDHIIIEAIGLIEHRLRGENIAKYYSNPCITQIFFVPLQRFLR